MTQFDERDDNLDPQLEDLAGYALDALSPAERIRVENLLAESEAARSELEELLEGASALGMSVPPRDPPAGLRDRLLNAAESTPQETPAAPVMLTATPTINARRSVLSRLAYASSGTALAASIAVAVFFGFQMARLGNDMESLKQQVEDDQAVIRQLEGQMATTTVQTVQHEAEVSRLAQVNDALKSAMRDQRWLTYVTQNHQWQVPEWFAGGPNAPTASGMLAVNRSSNDAALFVNDLQPAPPGHTYKLWLVRGLSWTPVTTFDVSEAGQARVDFEIPGGSVFDYSRATVTLEPLSVGSSETPAGDEVLKSSSQ
ncbi:MAG: anti-sigma factor [Dehalococcoidia bacterium]